MKEVLTFITSAITLLGVGGVVGGYITFRLNKSKDLEFKRREQKEKRYKVTLLFMDAYLEPKNMKFLNGLHSPFMHEDKRDVVESLKAEYRDMVLYGGREVIVALHDFIEAPSSKGFAKVMLEMRKDLWEKTPDLRTDELLLASPRQTGI